jgi:hypothetical protein
MTTPDAVDFFERQFQRQVRESDFALNPFEQLALSHVAGSVLDLGSSLGSTSLEAARRPDPDAWPTMTAMPISSAGRRIACGT